MLVQVLPNLLLCDATKVTREVLKEYGITCVYPASIPHKIAIQNESEQACTVAKQPRISVTWCWKRGMACSGSSGSQRDRNFPSISNMQRIYAQQ
jgi:hypothetical protein